MPPWPLQVPLPVEVLVVPSLQVAVAAESAARLGMVKANTSKGAANRLAIVVFFIENSRVIWLFKIVILFLQNAIAL